MPSSPPLPTLAPEIAQLQLSAVERLRAAGVRLPDAVAAELAEALLVDALGLALEWLEHRDATWR